MIFGEIESAISLLERISNFFKSRHLRLKDPVFIERFIQLFENHGVQRNQIPHFFDHGLKPKDVVSNNFLLDVLTNEMINDACILFAIRREWLDGTDNQIYPLHDFYKHPKDFSDFLDGLLSGNVSKETMQGVLLSQTEKYLNLQDDEALIILQEPIGTLGERRIYRYHICNNWLFSYWKSRAYLVSCVAIAWKKGVHLNGRKAEAALIKKYSQGDSFLDYKGESALPLRGEHWFPEDMTLHPKDFLNGIDPEKEGFGYHSALDLWLKLEKDGFMDAGLSQDSVRKKFENVQTEIQIFNIQKMVE